MKKYFTITISIILIALLIKLGLYSYYTEPAMLNITRYKLQDEQLSGIKIAFPSDFHVRPYQKERLNNIVQIISEENPDIVLSCGDYVAGHTKNVTMQIEEIAQDLSKIKSKHGFYTVLGNHDGWYGNERIKKALTTNGIKVVSFAAICFAIVNISVTAIVNASDVSFTSVITSLPIAGMTRLTTCGRMTRRKHIRFGMPSATAASVCPRSIDRIPPR